MREHYNNRECIRFNNQEPQRVTSDHPLIGEFVVLGAMHSMPYEILKSQVARLLQMPSCMDDPDFWRIIKIGIIPVKMAGGYNRYKTGVGGYRAVRQLMVDDRIEFAQEFLLRYNYITDNKL